MANDRQITLSILHDLALLYLGLAHGTDEALEESETKAIALKLRRWQPDKDPAMIDHVIREATLSYLNQARTNKMDRAIENIGTTLEEEERAEILRDLMDIARADGSVIPEEGGFIQEIARRWGVEISHTS